jgi:hypothetical protein
MRIPDHFDPGSGMEKFRSGIPDPQRCDFPCNVVDVVVDLNVVAVVEKLKILCDFPFNFVAVVEELVVCRQGGGGGPGAGRGSQQQQPGRGSNKEKR